MSDLIKKSPVTIKKTIENIFIEFTHGEILMFSGLKKTIKLWVIRAKNRKKNVKIGSGVILGRDVYFEGKNVIGNNTKFSGKIGRGSYIGQNCFINASIGRYCSISYNVSIVSGRHPISEFVSTHPCFYSTKKQAGFTYVNEDLFAEASKENGYSVIIGNDVCIGYGAIILSGVTIGDGAVIGAGAVVNQDVEPYSVVGGVPAKLIKKRFEDEQIETLLTLRWWDMPEEWIKENSFEFGNVESLITAVKKKDAKTRKNS